jgi:hypothetical protein
MRRAAAAFSPERRREIICYGRGPFLSESRFAHRDLSGSFALDDPSQTSARPRTAAGLFLCLQKLVKSYSKESRKYGDGWYRRGAKLTEVSYTDFSAERPHRSSASRTPSSPKASRLSSASLGVADLIRFSTDLICSAGAMFSGRVPPICSMALRTSLPTA